MMKTTVNRDVSSQTRILIRKPFRFSRLLGSPSFSLPSRHTVSVLILHEYHSVNNFYFLIYFIVDSSFL